MFLVFAWYPTGEWPSRCTPHDIGRKKAGGTACRVCHVEQQLACGKRSHLAQLSLAVFETLAILCRSCITATQATSSSGVEWSRRFRRSPPRQRNFPDGGGVPAQQHLRWTPQACCVVGRRSQPGRSAASPSDSACQLTQHPMTRHRQMFRTACHYRPTLLDKIDKNTSGKLMYSSMLQDNTNVIHCTARTTGTSTFPLRLIFVRRITTSCLRQWPASPKTQVCCRSTLRRKRRATNLSSRVR